MPGGGCLMRIPWTIEPRTDRAAHLALLAPLTAILATVLSGVVLMSALGVPAPSALYQLYLAPLSSSSNISEVVLKTAPLLLIAQGLAIGFRAKIWNIGAEGQLILGAIGGSLLPLWFNGSQNPLMLPAMALCGALFGMAWAAIAAGHSRRGPFRSGRQVI